MWRQHMRFTREDVMRGTVFISGTLCDFECLIVGNYPERHKVDNSVYTIDYKKTRTLKQMLRIETEMVETRPFSPNFNDITSREAVYLINWALIYLNKCNLEEIREPSSSRAYDTTAREVVNLIGWSLNFLGNYNLNEHCEPSIRVDRAITSSIQKVNEWFDVLEAKGVSIFERPDMCEPFTAPPGTLYPNQSIYTEDFLRDYDYRRRMGVANMQNFYQDYNVVNFQNAAHYRNMDNIQNSQCRFY